MMYSGTTKVDDNSWAEMDDCHIIDEGRLCPYGSAARMRTYLLRHFAVARFFTPSLYRDLHMLMGRVRARERRAGIRRDGPAGRARAEEATHLASVREDIAREVQRERAMDRQRESRRRRRHTRNSGADADGGSLSDIDVENQYGVNQRLVRRDVAGILACVQRTLGRHGRPLSHKRAVVRSVWDSPVIRELLPPEAQKVPSEVHAREGIVSGLLQSL